MLVKHRPNPGRSLLMHNVPAGGIAFSRMTRCLPARSPEPVGYKQLSLPVNPVDATAATSQHRLPGSPLSREKVSQWPAREYRLIVLLCLT